MVNEATEICCRLLVRRRSWFRQHQKEAIAILCWYAIQCLLLYCKHKSENEIFFWPLWGSENTILTYCYLTKLIWQTDSSFRADTATD